ncbi:MAG: hypothetical protein ABW318_21245, partial [Vicinamibacterales bacterium]
MPKPFEVPAASAEPSYRAALTDDCRAIAVDILEQIIRASGADPRTVTPERILQIARIHAGREMASVKLGKA